MNLIEQLGGYEQLKGYIDGALRGMPDSYCYEFDTVLGWKKLLNMRDVKCILLEHRRQHNIFEENDRIVFVDDFMHGELMVVAWTRKGEVWMDEGAKRCTELSMIRHATEAEIQAGRRL